MSQNLNQIDNYEYKGCYKDQSKRALKNKIGHGNINQCISLANKNNYDTVGIQNHNECWAGNNGVDDNNYSKYGTQTNINLCDVSKPGSWTNVVYAKNNPTQNNPTQNNPTQNNPTQNNPTQNNPTQNNPTNQISQVNYTYDVDAVPVYVIGNYDIAPWGAVNFSDRMAKWVWYSMLSNISAPVNVEPITIQYIFFNTYNNSINGILNVIVDDYCDINLNNFQIATNINAGWQNNWTQIKFTAQPGTNLFEFKVKSIGGPAGLLVSAIMDPNINPDNSNLLFHTDNSWKFIPTKVEPIVTCNLSQSGLINTTDKYFPWGCLTLNSSPAQYVNIGNTITGMNGLSFGCWFRSNNNTINTRVFDFGNGAGSDNIMLYINTNTIGAVLYTSNIGNALSDDIPTNINNNQWNHIVWTFSTPSNSNSNSNSNWIIYLNGQIAYNKPGTYPTNLLRTNCYLGKSNWTADSYFNGAMANFVMYQKELSGIEVNALYNNLIKSNDPALYLYLPFAINSVLDTMLNNYAGKQFNLPVSPLSAVPSENWNCMQEGNNWLAVKMSNGNPVCMSLDGKNCLLNNQETCNTRITNPVTPENPVICSESESENQTGWCKQAKNLFLSNSQVDIMRQQIESNVSNKKLPGNIKPNMVSSSTLSTLPTLPTLPTLSSNNMSSSTSTSTSTNALVKDSKVLTITNMNDVNNLMIGGVFKLRVNLPKMPPYIKGSDFDVQTGTDPNYFYLSIETLDNNCKITGPNGSCLNAYADNKKCSIKALTAYNLNNSYRLVLISSQYVLDPTIPLGKNSDFTLVQVGGQVYLKNIQTGYYPNLYSNDENILVYGDMQINPNTNVNTVQNLITNTLCGQEKIQNSTSENTTSENTTLSNPTLNTKFLRCNIEQDPGLYLMTSNNIGNSSPIRVNINNDNTISLNLLSFNRYGYPTKIYSLTYCNFNVKTYSYIEKMTNTLGTFLVNMVCFSDVQNTKESNVSKQLKFIVELISFPSNYIKENSVFTI